MAYRRLVICLKFSVLAGLLLFLQDSFAQVNKRNPKELGVAGYADLDAVVMKHQKALGNDLVAMVWTDTLVYKRELGDYDARTLAPVGNFSELLTTALLLKLAEEGKLSLDDKVSQYLPIFELYGKNYITIRHCLSHFTGIEPEAKMLDKKKFASLQEFAESFAKREIKTNPGTEAFFSLAGPTIAGRIAEIVTKKKFDLLIKQKLFNPLGMRKSTFSNADASAVHPADGAQSTAEDFLKFLQMLLSNGRINGQQFLTEASIEDMRNSLTSPSSIKYSPKVVEGYAYALGSWKCEKNSNSKAATICCPSLEGGWCVVDWDHKHAFLLMTKTPQADLKKEDYREISDLIK